jgi:4-hydroxy-tetrahydrodipicolinate synthase
VLADGALDTRRALAHAQRMLAAGCDGITLFGTTGEGPAFTVAERKALLEAMLANGITPDQCLVTTTALALQDSIDIGRHARRLGVHRQMYMPPFYFNQPREAGVLDAVSQVIIGIDDPQLKLMLYHFPAMSTYGFSHAAIAELVKRHPGQVVGVKDSAGSLEHALGLAKAFPHLSIFTGSEGHVGQVMVAGGSGSINGLTNIAPKLMRRVVSAPSAVSAADTQLIASLLSLLSIRPDMNFVCSYKTMLAEQLGDDAWLNVRAPLCHLEAEEDQAIRQGYRAIGAALSTI